MGYQEFAEAFAYVHKVRKVSEYEADELLRDAFGYAAKKEGVNPDEAVELVLSDPPRSEQEITTLHRELAAYLLDVRDRYRAEKDVIQRRN